MMRFTSHLTLSLTIASSLVAFAPEAQARHRSKPSPAPSAPVATPPAAVKPDAIENRSRGAWPTGPEDSITPGALCANPSEYRYPEHIKYCDRDVDPGLKDQIIRTYDQRFGYKIQTMPRVDFKIDHLIPLCAGGSNEMSNLWPQYKDVYEKTDRIEQSVCQLMSMGRMTQEDAVDLVLDVKHHLEKADAVTEDLLRRIAAH